MNQLAMVGEIELHKTEVKLEDATKAIVVGSDTNEIYVYRINLI